MSVWNRQSRWRCTIGLLALVVVLVACGGSTEGDGGEVTNAEGSGGDQSAQQASQSGSGDTSSAGSDGADTSTGGAMATLMVGSETYVFEGNEWTYCEIGGLFPANAEFQTEQDKRAGWWVQFIDRGDGGINFSAVLDGEEYSGTGSGEPDEITSNGFTYTGFLNNQGENYDVTLEVSCG